MCCIDYRWYQNYNGSLVNFNLIIFCKNTNKCNENVSILNIKKYMIGQLLSKIIKKMMKKNLNRSTEVYLYSDIFHFRTKSAL